MRTPLRALIVEDSEDDRRLLIRELDRQGFEVDWEQVCAASAMEDALRRREWDVVLADYRMPAFDAPGALAVLRSSGRDLPFLVISGNIGEDIAVEIMRAGAHDYLMKGNLKRIGAAIIREVREAKLRRERRLALVTLDHTNRVLQAVRQVNRLIVHEHDTERLIEAACECLVRTRGYVSAWIAELDSAGGVRHVACRGYGESESLLRDRIELGRLPQCAAKAMESGKTVIVDNQSNRCTDCPIHEVIGPHETLAVRIDHDNQTRGALCVQLPADIDADPFEISLVEELASDLGYALHSIAAEAERNSLRDALAARVLQVTCVRRIVGLVAENTGELRDLLADAAGLIPTGFPEPVSARARIVLDGEDFGPRFDPTEEHCYRTAIRIQGNEAGAVEIFSDHPLPETPPAWVDEIASLIGTALEREQTAGLLRRSQSLLDSAEEISGIGAWEWSVDRGEMFWTRETYRIHDLDPTPIDHFSEEHMALSVRCYASEDRTRIESAFRRCLRRGTPYDIECRFTSLKGRELWIRTGGRAERKEGRIVRVIGYIRDVTEQKSSEEALRRSEETFRLFFERVPQYCYLLSPADAILDVNSTALDALGYERGELVGRPITDLYTPESRDHAEKFLESLRETGRLENEELVVRTKSGEERTVLLDAVALSAADGSPWGSISVQRDISESKALGEQLRQAQKLEAVGQLAGGVAHDFNNLLTVILGQSELAAHSLRPEDPIAGKIDQISSAAERASALTRQLLAFSRKQTLASEVLDLNQVIRNLEQMLRRLIGENIRIEFVPAPDLERIFADVGQIEQVLVNLAVNAQDAMPGGGCLSIETASVELDPESVRPHLDVDPGRYVLLTVSDSGCGFDAATGARLFEPFFTTKVKGKGTGLGLSTVYGIVKQSGGDISVSSEPGVGTTFRIYLPCTENAPAEPAPAVDDTDSDRAGELILVAEDEPSIRDLMELMLTDLGYRVVMTSNGDEAMQAVEEPGLRPDLLITDVIMPGMSGATLAELLRKNRPDQKVLFMSGYTDDAIAQHGVLDPGVPFLPKPFTSRDLDIAIRNALRDKAQIDEG